MIFAKAPVAWQLLFNNRRSCLDHYGTAEICVTFAGTMARDEPYNVFRTTTQSCEVRGAGEAGQASSLIIASPPEQRVYMSQMEHFAVKTGTNYRLAGTTEIFF
jgi:hypothetical protein